MYAPRPVQNTNPRQEKNPKTISSITRSQRMWLTNCQTPPKIVTMTFNAHPKTTMGEGTVIGYGKEANGRGRV